MHFNRSVVYRRKSKEEGPHWKDFETWKDYEFYHNKRWFFVNKDFQPSFIKVYQDIKNIFGKYISKKNLVYEFQKFIIKELYRIYEKLPEKFLYTGLTYFVLSKFTWLNLFKFYLSCHLTGISKIFFNLSKFTKNLIFIRNFLSCHNVKSIKILFNLSGQSKEKIKIKNNLSKWCKSNINLKNCIILDPNRWISYSTWRSLEIATGGDWA